MGIIDRILKREGRETNDPDDSGGQTDYGISKAAHPEAWADGKVTLDEAEHIYEDEYLKPFKSIPDRFLQEQLADFGVTSGVVTAARTLQRILSVPLDGDIGPQTLNAIQKFAPTTIFGFMVPGGVALNLALERERAAFLVRDAQARPKDTKYLFGWLKRVVGIRNA